LLAVVVIAHGCGRLHLNSAAEQALQVERALRAKLNVSRPEFVTADTEGARLWKQTRKFYQHHGFAPVWIDRLKPRSQMDALITAIKAADLEGLDPELYNISALEAQRQTVPKGFLVRKSFEPAEAAMLDLWLTYLYMKYASDLADGISDLAHADAVWKIKSEKFDPLAHFEKALADDRIGQSLLELTPNGLHYHGLREALAAYRDLARRGGWPSVPVTTKIKPGQHSTEVTTVARRLFASGDYRGTLPASDEPMMYGVELEEAVKRFQRRHGLQEGGIVGPAIVAEMNVPIEERIRQIALNLERWRWLPRELGSRHILVNIPAYRLDVWENGQVPLSMRVVVGKKDSPTPIFNDEMTHIVFSPYWNVPPDIARDETLPALMKDGGFLERTNMEVVDASGNVVDAATIDLSDPARYRFRQRPGSTNSLGLVKFMFPNRFNVYLHDTPAESLFARASRSFSHGCVRLEKPQALAEYALRDQPEWTTERIEEAMHGGEERTVKLRTPIPVYFGYWTAAVTPDGLVQFTKDVYGIDARQGRNLAQRLAGLKKAAENATAARGNPQKQERRGELLEISRDGKTSAAERVPGRSVSGTQPSALRDRAAGTAWR
jgi:murein L,D-transpeptidase YcbB/YkuD